MSMHSLSLVYIDVYYYMHLCHLKLSMMHLWACSPTALWYLCTGVCRQYIGVLSQNSSVLCQYISVHYFYQLHHYLSVYMSRQCTMVHMVSLKTIIEAHEGNEYAINCYFSRKNFPGNMYILEPKLAYETTGSVGETSRQLTDDMVPQYQPLQERASLDKKWGTNNLNSTSNTLPHIFVPILLDDDDDTQDKTLLYIPKRIKIEGKGPHSTQSVILVAYLSFAWLQGSLLMCIVMDHGMEVHGPWSVDWFQSCKMTRIWHFILELQGKINFEVTSGTQRFSQIWGRAMIVVLSASGLYAMHTDMIVMMTTLWNHRMGSQWIKISASLKDLHCEHCSLVQMALMKCPRPQQHASRNSQRYHFVK